MHPSEDKHAKRKQIIIIASDQTPASLDVTMDPTATEKRSPVNMNLRKHKNINISNKDESN